MEQESNKWNKEGFVNLLITQAKGSDGNLKTWSSFSSRIRVSVTKVWTQMAFAYTGKGISGSGSGTDKGKHVTAMPIKDSRVCLRQPPSPRETLGGGGSVEWQPKERLRKCLVVGRFPRVWSHLGSFNFLERNKVNFYNVIFAYRAIMLSGSMSLISGSTFVLTY